MKLRENSTIEFKREWTDDIKKTVVAFANSDGGILSVGIEDDGNVVGVNDANSLLLKISNSVRDTIKPDVTLFVDYTIEKIEGKDIVKVTVQKGSACPYYIAGKGIRPEGVFVRHGASSVPATETAILKMIKETDGEKYENLRSLAQDLTFKETEKEFALSNVPFGTEQKRTLGILNRDGIYSNLGLLLSDQCRHSIKTAVFQGRDKGTFKDRREFSGSLLKQLNDSYDFLDRHNNLRSDINGLHRTDKRDYPSDAVREALLNAIIHRDYSFSGSILVSVFDDRIEFLSIGGIVKGISFDDIMLGISVARNEKLADVFYRLTLVEAYGTGIPKIIRSYENFDVKPQIAATDNAFKITLHNVNVTEAKAKAEEPQHFTSPDPVMELLRTNEFITRHDVERVLSVSPATAIRFLRGLVADGQIKIVGKGKNTRYSRQYDLND